MINHHPEILCKVETYFRKNFEGVFAPHSNWGKIAADTLSEERIKEQINLFLKSIQMEDAGGKKLLEIGSGFGLFVALCKNSYGMQAYGIEPDNEVFSISKEILSFYNIRDDVLKKNSGEALPFDDESFDLVFSTNVLEHVNNPEKVIAEAVRVLKKGGSMQFVIPNYNSFFEGHYGILWFPFLSNKKLAKAYVSLYGRNPAYIDSLQFITPQYLKKILKRHHNIDIHGFGVDIFEKRLKTLCFSEWGFLDKIKPCLEIAHSLKLISLALFLSKTFEWHTPIILTIKKKSEKNHDRL